MPCQINRLTGHGIEKSQMKSLPRVKKLLVSTVGVMSLAGLAFAPAALADDEGGDPGTEGNYYTFTGSVAVPAGFDTYQVDAYAEGPCDGEEGSQSGEDEGEDYLCTVWADFDYDESESVSTSADANENEIGFTITLSTGDWDFYVSSWQDGLSDYNATLTVPPADQDDLDLGKIELEKVKVNPTVRYDGTDRYGTNYKVVEATMEEGDPVFIATGAEYPDALTIGQAATGNWGALVLTPPNAMRAEMLDLLKANAPSQVYTVGGKSAVSDNVIEQVAKATGVTVEDKTIVRIGGKDRYETSQAILSEFFGGEDGIPYGQAFLATGRDYPDALSASAVGGAVWAPVVLVKGTSQTSLDPELAKQFEADDIDTLKLVGGPAAIGAKLEYNLADSGYSVQRLAGADRYGTNLRVNQ